MGGCARTPRRLDQPTIHSQEAWRLVIKSHNLLIMNILTKLRRGLGLASGSDSIDLRKAEKLPYSTIVLYKKITVVLN